MGSIGLIAAHQRLAPLEKARQEIYRDFSLVLVGSNMLIRSTLMSPFPGARLLGLAAKFDAAEYSVDSDHDG